MKTPPWLPLPVTAAAAGKTFSSASYTIAHHAFKHHIHSTCQHGLNFKQRDLLVNAQQNHEANSQLGQGVAAALYALEELNK